MHFAGDELTKMAEEGMKMRGTLEVKEADGERT